MSTEICSPSEDRLRRTAMFDLLMPMLWLFIGMVSAYDSYLLVKYQREVYEIELNPVGRWLIDTEGGSVALFIGLKIAGTVVALGIMIMVYRFRASLGVIVVSAVASFQALLALYLTYG